MTLSYNRSECTSYKHENKQATGSSCDILHWIHPHTIPKNNYNIPIEWLHIFACSIKPDSTYKYQSSVATHDSHQNNCEMSSSHQILMQPKSNPSVYQMYCDIWESKLAQQLNVMLSLWCQHIIDRLQWPKCKHKIVSFVWLTWWNDWSRYMY